MPRSLFNLKLESPCAEILARKDVLLTVTANCQIRVMYVLAVLIDLFTDSTQCLQVRQVPTLHQPQSSPRPAFLLRHASSTDRPSQSRPSTQRRTDHHHH